MRLVLIVHSLGSGGAERVISRLANHWAAAGHEIWLITFDQSQRDFYALDAGISRVVLGHAGNAGSIWQAMWGNWQRMRSLRRALESIRPQSAIAFMESANVLTIIASIGLRIRTLISERSNPEANVVPIFWRVARLTVYRFADRLILQTAAARRWYAERGISRAVRVIPNPLEHLRLDPKDIETWRREAAMQSGSLLLLAVGRLSREKGFDLLVEAFDSLRRSHPEFDVQLLIAGDGPLRAEIQASIERRGLSGSARLLGGVRPIEPLIAAADIFVLTSRYEGFPNVLVEAMSLGKAVVSVDCPFGPSEIISDSENGLLVRTREPVALAAAMAALLRDPVLRSRLGEVAARDCERYRIEKIAAAWEAEIQA